MSRYDPWQSGGIGWICIVFTHPIPSPSWSFKIPGLQVGIRTEIGKPHGETAETQVEIQILDEGGMLLDGGPSCLSKDPPLEPTTLIESWVPNGIWDPPKMYMFFCF